MMPPNTGGRPMVVVMMKGGGQPNLNGLPFMMGGPPPPAGGKKKKKKSKGGKKKAKKAGGPAKTKKSGEEDSDSDSDRVNAPDIPAAHTHKPPPGAAGGPAGGAHANNSGGRGGPAGAAGAAAKKAPGSNPMASSFGSADGAGGTGGAAAASSSTTSTTSNPAAGAADAAGAAKKTPAKKPAVKKAPAKPGIKKEAFIIKDGNVDKSCVPAFVLVEGPAGCPIIVPIDARDENAIVNELGPQPLKTAPKETVRGYLVINEEGLLYFKPQKECKEAPFASTPGQLQKFLTNSNIFIADAGPQLPDDKAFNKASTATKDKIGGKDIAVSGHITMVQDKGTCKFTRVVITQSFPFYPSNAAFGVLVRDFTNGYVYFVPTENRFVGMVLSQGIKQVFKPVIEAQIVGNIYKDVNGAAVWEVPSEKKDNLMGYIMSSSTGVPIYVPKPDDNAPARAVAAPKGKGKAAVTPGAVSSSVTGQTSAASPAGSTTSVAAAAAGGAAPAADGTASTTVPIGGAAAQTGETGGVVKAVESVTLVQGGGGVTSMTVPIGAAPSDPAAVAAAGAETAKEQINKLVANENELGPAPPPAPEPEQPPAAKEEEKQEEKKEEEAPPPPPPKPEPKTPVNETAKEYKKFLDDRSAFL